jgi:archaellum biogenesis protein FlaJ (TadC family)
VSHETTSTHSEQRGDRTTHDASGLSVLDRALYALFARHADHARHDRDRHRYRATDIRTSFDLYLARVYGLSWLGVAVAVLCVFVVAATVLPLPVVVRGVRVPAVVVLLVSSLLVGTVAKRGVLALGRRYLSWQATARRENIERTLPGAVRYLHVLSSGSDDLPAMFHRVADTDAYGETAVAFRKALNTAALTGSVGEGLRRVARDTPSRDVLAPFLLKFREHANQGPDALRTYLRMESRMLGFQQDRARQRAEGFLQLLSELFIVLLVLPALLVIVLTVMSVISPGLSTAVTTPLGETTVRGVVVYASAVFIIVVGVAASGVVADLRPPDQRIAYARPGETATMLRTAALNPASAAVVAVVPGVGAAIGAWWLGLDTVDVVLVGYVTYALPVGGVSLRRARLDDAKDRELKDFVHAVSGHVTLGRPFPHAVELVATQVDLGPLNADVADLALNLNLTSPAAGVDENVRTAALERFVARVGTPLAEQTVGLVTGALDAGSDTETVFETLQTEVGRLYHEKRALRSALLAYVAVGWTTAILVVGITVAVSVYVFDGFAQLSALSDSSGFVLVSDAVDLERDRFRVYVVTQATVLASGWFAGMASRDRYEALLHSGALVAACYVVYHGVGIV